MQLMRFDQAKEGSLAQPRESACFLRPCHFDLRPTSFAPTLYSVLVAKNQKPFGFDRDCSCSGSLRFLYQNFDS